MNLLMKGWGSNSLSTFTNFSSQVFSSGSSANKWSWWPLETVTFQRLHLLLHITVLTRGHHGHWLALEIENGKFENFAPAPSSVIFNDSWVISMLTHMIWFAFNFKLIKNIFIMNLWLTSRIMIIKNVAETKYRNGPFSTVSANKWPHWTLCFICN